MTTGETNPAHGGKLIDLVVTGDEAKALRERAPALPVVTLNSRTLSDLELLAVGGYSPLEGFMTQADYRSVVDDMHLADGLPWSMPITLAVSDDEAAAIKEGDDIALADEAGRVLAVDAGAREVRLRQEGRGARRSTAPTTRSTPASPRSTRRATRCSAGRCRCSKCPATTTSRSTA